MSFGTHLPSGVNHKKTFFPPHSSKHVEKKLRQVERMQSSISHWKGKIAATTAECEERNSYLRAEKENLVHHY